MHKSSPSKSIAFKLIDNLINFAIYHGADSIHLEKALADNRIAVHYFGASELNSTWSLPAEFSEQLWSHLLSISSIDDQQSSGYFLLPTSSGMIHCRLEHLSAAEFSRLIINLHKHNESTHWSGAQFDSQVADQVLSVLDGKGLAILSGKDKAFTSQLAYILLSSLTHDKLCLASIESPVMANLPEVNQCQWQEGQGLSYDQLFKHIVAQDPDIIYADHLDKIDPHHLSQAASNKLVLASAGPASVVEIIKNLLSNSDHKQVLGKLKFILHAYLVKQNCPHCLEQCRLSQQDNDRLAALTGLDTKTIQSMDFAQSRGCLSCDFKASKNHIPLYDVLFLNPELINKLSSSKKTTALIEEYLELNALEDAWLKSKLKLISPIEIINQFS